MESSPTCKYILGKGFSQRYVLKASTASTLGILSSTTLAIFLDDLMGASFLFRYSVIFSHFPYIILPLVGVKAVETFRQILFSSFIVLLLIIIDDIKGMYKSRRLIVLVFLVFSNLY